MVRKEIEERQKNQDLKIGGLQAVLVQAVKQRIQHEIKESAKEIVREVIAREVAHRVKAQVDYICILLVSVHLLNLPYSLPGRGTNYS